MSEKTESTSDNSCGCSGGPLIVSAKGSHKVFTAKTSKQQGYRAAKFSCHECGCVEKRGGEIETQESRGRGGEGNWKGCLLTEPTTGCGERRKLSRGGAPDKTDF